MLLRVVVPPANAAFRAGVIAKWHVEQDEAISFGTPLCDISIDEFVALQRTKRASLLGSTTRLRKRRVSDGIDHREGRGAVTIRLTSAETNLVLRHKEVGVGDRVAVGSLVALLGTREAEMSQTPPQASARIAVDFPDPEEFDPFEV